MFIDFQTLKRILPNVIRARLPILIRARHGVGKSEVVKSLDTDVASILYPNEADRIKAFGKADYIYPVVERRASQMADAGDLMGLPKLTGETTTFLPMSWFYKACKEPCILFVDELDRGAQDVRQAFFEMSDSRKIAGHVLHPDTIIVACVNGGVGENAYQVGDMDPAEIDRWAVFDVRPTVKDWLDYSKDKVDPVIHDFIRNHNGHLEHSADHEVNKVYPSRRSWFRLNACLKGTDIIERATDQEKDASLELYHLSDAFVGQETAIAFQDFCKTIDKQITVEDILIKGKLVNVKKLEINQHMAIIEKFEEHPLLKTELDQSKLDNLGRYIFTIPPELAFKAWDVVTRSNATNGINLHLTVVDKKSVSGYLAKLNGHVDEGAAATTDESIKPDPTVAAVPETKPKAKKAK